MHEAAGAITKAIQARGVQLGTCDCCQCFVSSKEREAVRDAVVGMEDEMREELSSITSKADLKIAQEQAYLRKLESTYEEHYKKLQDEDAQPPKCCCCL